MKRDLNVFVFYRVIYPLTHSLVRGFFPLRFISLDMFGSLVKKKAGKKAATDICNPLTLKFRFSILAELKNQLSRKEVFLLKSIIVNKRSFSCRDVMILKK
jgi:hypothetical protein